MQREINSDVSVLSDDSLSKDGFQTDIRRYLQQCVGEECNRDTGMVESNPGRSNSNSGQKLPGGGQISMAKLERKSPAAYKAMAEETESLGRNFFQYVNGPHIQATWRYLSDVILYDSDRNLFKILEVLRNYGRHRERGFFGFSVEEDHIHVVHDCAYSAGCCRDAWRRKIEPFGQLRPTRTENKPIFKFKRSDWYDVFIYFFLEKRGTREIWIGGESWKKPDNDQLVRWERERESWGQVVGIQDSGSDSEREQSENKRKSRGIDSDDIDGIYGKKRRKKAGKFGYIKEKTKALLLKYYPAPTNAIKNVKEFRDDYTLSDPKNKEYVQSALDDFGMDINIMSMREIFEIVSKQEAEPIFFTSMLYGTMEHSIQWIDDLLKYQFDDDEERIQRFLQNVIDILDKKIPKCNALSIQSPPSAGKNFFFDMVFALCNNYGQLGIANRHNVFAFQEAPNKRLIVWNEPNYESALTDTIKMMMGGDPYNVRVKHQADQHVKRTPVIILTNNNLGMLNDPCFYDRIKKYNWRAAPFLKEIDCKPFPMAFFEILNKYNIKW